uniref:Uncharacterized protein n=1 Tax=Oryza barthii TaxID=65489 RepID=A0A0D3FIL8_9ORYZ
MVYTLSALPYKLCQASTEQLTQGVVRQTDARCGRNGTSPFEYVKGDDGRTVIKVTLEFIVRSITSSRPIGACAAAGDEEVEGGGGGGGAPLCSTPELRKHYEQLVGAARCRAWSPRLETIKERKGARRIVVAAVSPGRLSPVAARLLGLDRGAS